MRQNFNAGMEVVSEDHNKASARTEKFLLDQIIFELIGRNSEGFFQDSFNVTRVSNTEVSVTRGLGFQSLVTDSFEPSVKPLSIDSNTSKIIATANPTNDRIDLLVVRAELVDDETENRKNQEVIGGPVDTKDFVVSKKWEATIDVVTGNPDPSPVPPAVPTGYILISEILIEAANGIVSQSNITDRRELLPLAASVGETGSREFDAITGDTSKLGFSHESLKAALDDPNIGSGSKILVTRDEMVGVSPEVLDDDIEIVYKPNVTMIKDGATKGLIINANGVKVTGARFQDFSGSGDIGIEIVSSKQYNDIQRCRFSNCDEQISGITGKNIVTNNFEE